MLKKILVILAIIGSTLGAITAIDYFVDDIDLYGRIMSIFDEYEEDVYTDNNISSFTPIRVKGNLKPAKYTGSIATVPVLYGNTVINMPIPAGAVWTTYNDTVYDPSGSVYCVASKSETGFESVEEITKREHNLGRGEPKVFEFMFPDSKAVVYVQCYTPEVYGFYQNLDCSEITFSTTKYDLTIADDELADSVKIPIEIISSNESSYLDEVYLEIVQNYRDEYEGYSNFVRYYGKLFNYYRTVGFLDTRMKVEYARMVSLGYTPRSYGYYKGVAYIEFDELMVLGSNITNNSCLIYRVTK